MPVHTIGVIGAGTMGSGIAQAAATKGFHVILIDTSEAAVGKGIDAVEGRLARMVAKGKMSGSEREAALGSIHGTTAYAALKPADVVIEAATENYDLKVKILKQIDPLVRSETVIASNTSSVSITKLASVISHPDRFIGMHFSTRCRSWPWSKSSAGCRPATPRTLRSQRWRHSWVNRRSR